jgi:hypothetical protein
MNRTDRVLHRPDRSCGLPTHGTFHGLTANVPIGDNKTNSSSSIKFVILLNRHHELLRAVAASPGAANASA